MVNIIIIFVIGIFFLVVAFRMKAGLKIEQTQMDNYKQTLATINRVIYSDTGNVKYYVTFTENDREITAQTDHYSSETKSLNPGDEVKIGYFYLKNGLPRAVIIDERVIPLSNSMPVYYRFFAVVGLVVTLVALTKFIQMFFKI